MKKVVAIKRRFCNEPSSEETDWQYWERQERMSLRTKGIGEELP